MSGHHPRRSTLHRRPAHPALWAAAAVIIVVAVAACTSTATTSTSATAVAAASTGPGGHKPTLTGAGSTFDAPFFAAAFPGYQQQHPGVTIGYSAVGSSAGIAAISAQQVNFGASDVPMTASEQAAAKGGPITQVPVDLGGEGVAYNLSLPAGARLHLTGPVLAGIFLGQITHWNDPALTALNPGLSLPPAAINVVHRSDGSGTTYIFSNYLSSVDPTWASKVGTGKTLNWPTGEGAEGNSSVATAVNRCPETQHHPHRLLHRQPARRQQLPHQRLQLGTDLHPPAQPGHRTGPRRHARLAHPHRPGLRRRQQLRAPATPDPATRPHHAPADHRPHRDTPPELIAAPP